MQSELSLTDLIGAGSGLGDDTSVLSPGDRRDLCRAFSLVRQKPVACLAYLSQLQKVKAAEDELIRWGAFEAALFRSSPGAEVWIGTAAEAAAVLAGPRQSADSVGRYLARFAVRRPDLVWRKRTAARRIWTVQRVGTAEGEK